VDSTCLARESAFLPMHYSVSPNHTSQAATRVVSTQIGACYTLQNGGCEMTPVFGRKSSFRSSGTSSRNDTVVVMHGCYRCWAATDVGPNIQRELMLSFGTRGEGGGGGSGQHIGNLA
jgi:hypothetical protein